MKQKSLIIIGANLAIVAMLAVTAITLLRKTSSPETAQDLSSRAQTTTRMQNTTPSAASTEDKAKEQVTNDVSTDINDVDAKIQNVNNSGELPTINPSDFQ